MDKTCFDTRQGRKFEESFWRIRIAVAYLVAFNFKNMNIIFHSLMRLILVTGEGGGESSKTQKRGGGSEEKLMETCDNNISEGEIAAA